MNRNDTLTGLKALKARYNERLGLTDQAAVELWINYFAASTATGPEFLEACNDWIANNHHPPTCKEIGDLLKHHHRPTTSSSRTRCDGTGWINPHDDGLQPCPTCSPWQRQQWETGTWHDHPISRAPASYIMPPRCKPLAEHTLTPTEGRPLVAAALATIRQQLTRP